jgi:hypothetical protein
VCEQIIHDAYDIYLTQQYDKKKYSVLPTNAGTSEYMDPEPPGSPNRAD